MEQQMKPSIRSFSRNINRLNEIKHTKHLSSTFGHAA